MKLLQLEWLKVKNYSTFWILIGLFCFIYIASNYGLNNGNISFRSLLGISYAFPSVWSSMGFIYSWFVIFLCVFVIISISNEFTFKTNRQHIIDGLHRLEFLHAKCLMVLSLTTAITSLFVIIGFVFGFANGDGNPFENMQAIAYVFLYTLNYLSFAALIAFFVRRSGLSIIFLLAYFFIESILGSIVNFKFNTYAGNLLFLQCSDELLPLNMVKTISNMTGTNTHQAPTYVLVVFSVAYIALYYVLVRRKMLKADL